MAVPTIGFLGEEYNLLIRQGATFGPVTVTMTNPDTTPVNLTGCTIRGKIRRKALDAAVVATFTVSITDAVNGGYQFSLTDEVTSAMTAGEYTSSSESKYVWDLEMEDTLGKVLPLYYGKVTVLREVTR
jgi:hypothetical protein